jgi:maltooligosyltrehalose trehalohydrolase
LKPATFVNYIQNHDQVANSGRGERVHRLTSPGRYRAMTALLLLAPGTPMLFQGQEFAASSPFLYFADHKDELAPQIYQGRVDFLSQLSQFRSLAGEEMQGCLPDPKRDAFERSKLDFADRDRNAPVYAFHRDLLKLRREDAVFQSQRSGEVDGAVLGAEAFVLRYFGDGGDDRLLLVNLGRDLNLNPAPEPLMAPPSRMRWCKLWSTEEPVYGGCGYPELETEENWMIPGHAAAVLAPRPPSPGRLERERRLEQETAARRKREKQQHG